jgi:Xaa-Pro dipeptidase
LIEGYEVEDTVIYPSISDSRVTKTELEIDVMRWASKITCEGHIEFLKHCKPGMRESKLESIFLAYCS